MLTSLLHLTLPFMVVVNTSADLFSSKTVNGKSALGFERNQLLDGWDSFMTLSLSPRGGT